MKSDRMATSFSRPPWHPGALLVEDAAHVLKELHPHYILRLARDSRLNFSSSSKNFTNPIRSDNHLTAIDIELIWRSLRSRFYSTSMQLEGHFDVNCISPSGSISTPSEATFRFISIELQTLVHFDFMSLRRDVRMQTETTSFD